MAGAVRQFAAPISLRQQCNAGDGQKAAQDAAMFLRYLSDHYEPSNGNARTGPAVPLHRQVATEPQAGVNPSEQGSYNGAHCTCDDKNVDRATIIAATPRHGYCLEQTRQQEEGNREMDGGRVEGAKGCARAGGGFGRREICLGQRLIMPTVRVRPRNPFDGKSGRAGCLRSFLILAMPVRTVRQSDTAASYECEQSEEDRNESAEPRHFRGALLELW